MSEVSLLNVLLEQGGIFFMAERQSRQGNEFGFLVRAGMMDQMMNVQDGIAHDLAFAPAESIGESL